MGAMVYDCEQELRDKIERLRERGAEDREIVHALRAIASEIEYRHWGRDDW